ncbi:hypothetical protein AA14337_2999 [Acetobacter malorum DSM 14337]|uniref:DUF4031 domain-containing protein n=1 Tax=Acetobacter malorum DSM 14337 TaxID=1307910 RepID=A0ABQ0PZ32_9PROT|nr:DUF4031 domain-containing protein [Acetobacter malorum]KXV06706.1 hypothetical protein AD930_06270 [Acetobacter malorum]GBQ85124.1 hypothetical protein AA14337_2999 [Acetobacter malorum DSM 14337]
MSVFVDDVRIPYRRMLMCHMWADTEAELLDMADKIGVPRKWIQTPPKASWVHFDICVSKRSLAVKAGAIQTDKYGPVEFTTIRRLNALKASDDADKAKVQDRIKRHEDKLATIKEIRESKLRGQQASLF